MNKKVYHYLNNKDPLTYTRIDHIFAFYSSHRLHEVLFRHQVTGLACFPSMHKNGKSLQMHFTYYNVSVVFEFREDDYEYGIYVPGCSVEEIEESMTKAPYYDTFTIEAWIQEFFVLLEHDPRLIKEVRMSKKEENKKKTYTILSFVALVIPWFILGSIALFSYILKKDIKLNEWFSLVIIVPLILWFVFDVTSNRNKKK